MGLTKMYNIEELVEKAVLLMIRNTRGQCLTFTPKKVAKFAKLDTKPVTLSVVRWVIENRLTPHGIRIYKRSSHGVKYIVDSTSPLWNKAKSL